jgi:hypothetical protein
VRGVVVDDPDAVEVAAHGMRPVKATLVEQVATSDLALLKLSQPVGSALPLASRCCAGDGWFAPARPSLSDPQLVGQVATPTISHQCVAGGTIDAVQLTTQSDLGGYHGYSGGPVFLSPEACNKVIGILIEQYPDRIDARRATNTLFAAAITDAIDQFDSLTNAYLLRMLVDGKPAAIVPRPKRRAKPSAEHKAILDILDKYGIIDPEIRTVYQVLVSKLIFAPPEDD